MLPWSLDEVLRATGGELSHGWEGADTFPILYTDTREEHPGGLFVPLRGERFDGHDYVARALASGAGAALWARPEVPEGLPSGRLIRVRDGLQAYQALGRAHRRRLGVPVVAVTGSVGKTTTKDLVAALLEARLRVHRSRLNFNNEVGVPRSLLELEPGHDVAVLELGMRGPGQIRELARLVEARVGVITRIGESHLELLGSREALADAKAELLEEMPGDGVAVLPRHDEFFERLRGRARGRVVTFAPAAPADWSVARVLSQGLEGCELEVRHPGGTSRLAFSLPGTHNLSNLVAALAVAAEFGLAPEDVAGAAARFRPSGLRSEVRRLDDGTVLLNDSYNAAPSSMQGALEILALAGGRKVAVLGDMLELGASEEEMHRATGELAAKAGVDVLVAVGPRSRALADGARSSSLPTVRWAADRDEAWSLLRAELRPGDTVLIKASRGVGLDVLAERLQEEVQR